MSTVLLCVQPLPWKPLFSNENGCTQSSTVLIKLCFIMKDKEKKKINENNTVTFLKTVSSL